MSEVEPEALTAAEALGCGCALVASDSGGVRDYEVDGETAVVVRSRDASALAAGVLQLIRDDELRLRLATAGHRNIQVGGGLQWPRRGGLKWLHLASVVVLLILL
jgi:L-malate glycosyltransferase